MSLLGATILTAVATLALAVLALATAVFAWLAFRRQSQEVGILVEQNKRDIDERRRAQAVRVFIGAPQGSTNDMEMFAKNASEFPVYDAQIRYLRDGGLTGPESLGSIMPGTQKHVRKHGRRDAVATAVLTFQDAAGINWIRMPDGSVTEQDGASVHDSILTVARAQNPLVKGF